MPELTAGWLRQRFAGADNGVAVAPPDGWIGDTILGSDVPLVPAAVLIPIVLRHSGLTVLLTQRTVHLRDHAGQVSFPGGRCESTDPSPTATALREAEEEIGVSPAQVEVLGMLNEYRTGTGFAIQPVVGLVTPPLDLKLDDFEVADVFEPPLEFLLDPANFRREEIEYRGAMREYWAVPWHERYIWGATAGILLNLREFLFGGM
jgi:8-oxo-dGTP pyrophosphatase MutT (NUDIX family)